MTKPNTTPQPCALCAAPYMRTRAHNSAFCTARCRFMAKVKVSEGGCWEWIGAEDGHGYGQINIGGRPVKAHRWAFEHIGGEPLSSVLVIDHLCRNRACVNPAHMEQVTNRTNSLRGESPSIVTRRTGICQRGHSMEDAIVKPNGDRTCRACENARQMRYYYQRRDVA